MGVGYSFPTILQGQARALGKPQPPAFVMKAVNPLQAKKVSNRQDGRQQPRPAKQSGRQRSEFRALEMLEDRRMMSVTWVPWATILGQDKVVANYPWLTGGGNGVAV